MTRRRKPKPPPKSAKAQPEEEDRIKLWKILSAQYKIELDSDTLDILALSYEISGRTIKQLCKLAKMWQAVKKLPLNEEVFETLLEFQDAGDKAE